MQKRLIEFVALLLVLPLCITAGGAENAAAPDLEAIFPDGLVNSAGEKVSIDTLEGKVVGLYFSAHWCGPCRRFTPKLVEYRNKHQDDFEVVFISSDKSQDKQFSYMKEAAMPWPALKWKSGPANTLDARFQVRSIPTLVLLKPDGTPLTTDGRSFVSQGVEAAKFKTASIEEETYLCGRCDKKHTRPALVFD